MELSKKQKKEIIVMDLREVSKVIKRSQSDGDEFFREMTAIDNAIIFLEE